MSWKIRKKYFSIWRSYISSYCLPSLIEQIWMCLSCKDIDLASRGQRCSLPLQRIIWKVQHQKFIGLQNCLLHGEQQDLKNAKYKDKVTMYWCFSYNYFMASNNLNFSLLQEQRCCSTSSLLVGFPLTLLRLLPEFTALYLLFSTHSVHYFIFLTTTKLAFSQSCITTSASSEGCQLRAHHYVRQD